MYLQVYKFDNAFTDFHLLLWVYEIVNKSMASYALVPTANDIEVKKVTAAPGVLSEL